MAMSAALPTPDYENHMSNNECTDGPIMIDKSVMQYSDNIANIRIGKTANADCLYSPNSPCEQGQASAKDNGQHTAAGCA